jgi:GNAT superfamily N-acetyltransferase
VATNADASYPAPGGELWPGAGAILAAVETASDARATVIGKPHRPLFEAALDRVGTWDALMVGDRIETDLVGAVSTGIDAALVLSGVSTPGELLEHDALPVAILPDVGGLLEDRPRVTPRPAEAGEMGAVRALTEAPDTAHAWGADGVWVIADGEVDATATIDVRGEDAYLRAVATREGLRRHRLGTLVVAAAVGSARRGGAKRAWLLTETAERFFTTLGFETVDRASIPGWIEAGPADACPTTAVAMRREMPQ